MALLFSVTLFLALSKIFEKVAFNQILRYFSAKKKKKNLIKKPQCLENTHIMVVFNDGLLLHEYVVQA